MGQILIKLTLFLVINILVIRLTLRRLYSIASSFSGCLSYPHIIPASAKLGNKIEELGDRG